MRPVESQAVTIGSIVFLGAGFLLLLIWVLYPLSVAAVAKGARARRAHETGPVPDPAPSVTVVVASRESTEALRRRVENLRSSTYPAEALQILVAYDWRVRLPSDLAGAMYEAGAEVVRGDPPGGKAAALNAGVRCAAATSWSSRTRSSSSSRPPSPISSPPCSHPAWVPSPACCACPSSAAAA